MFGFIGGVMMPAAAIVVAVGLALFTESAGGGADLSGWRLVVISFMAGGVMIEIRSMRKDMVTKIDLAKFKEDLRELFQTKDECEDLHGHKHSRGASAGG